MARALLDEGEHVALLYSGMKTGYSGRYSYLAYGEETRIEGEDVHVLAACESDTRGHLPHWFGVAGYEANHAQLGIALGLPCSLHLPTVRFCRFRNVLRYDHVQRDITSEGHGSLPDISTHKITECDITPVIAHIQSCLPWEAYHIEVDEALEHINAGAFYQANLTRKYQGAFASPLSSLQAYALFTSLDEESPAPYSALLSWGEEHLISSSPELFLGVDATGTLTTRPIKGTVPSSTTAEALQHSAKDRAENLMIVDLMRNDMAQCAVAGSVHVPAMFEVDSFATLKHLSSTITAKARADASLLDMLTATFPAGSMTGAPKRAAMQWLVQKEGMQRGWYSGALGWIHGRQCELSVVIRTLAVQRERFEFQVGGGIVSDSTPEKEYAETLTKARGICAALGIELER
jgi:anthranilate/para-aminobenzoate synthase component I